MVVKNQASRIPQQNYVDMDDGKRKKCHVFIKPLLELVTAYTVRMIVTTGTTKPSVEGLVSETLSLLYL